MDRILRTLLAAAALTLLVAGVAQAVKPGTTSGVSAWTDNGDGSSIAIPTGGSPALIATLTLPADGKFVINASVSLVNSDTEIEALISCDLRDGVTFGGTLLDQADVKLTTFTASGRGSAKVAMTAALSRAAAAAGTTVHVDCRAAGGSAVAAWGNLNAISVSTLTVQ